MSTLRKNTLIRKITLGLGAIVISSMALASTADAKANIYVQLGFGSGWVGAGPGWAYGPGLGDPCWYYWKKFKKTGNGYWKMKYNKCMWYY